MMLRQYPSSCASVGSISEVRTITELSLPMLRNKIKTILVSLMWNDVHIMLSGNTCWFKI
jgi:hypothetical protein